LNNNNNGFNGNYNNNGYNNGFNGNYNNNGYNNGFNGNYNNNGYNNGFNGNYNNNGYNNGFNGDYNNNGYNNGFNGDYNNSGYNNGFNDNYNNNGYNNGFNNYDNIKRDPNIPIEIYREHPDARMATKKDGMVVLIIATLMVVVLGVLSAFMIIFVYNQAAETERIIGYNVTVEGTVTDTWTKRTSSRKSTTTHYYASYRYFYNNSGYFGTTKMSRGSLVEGQKITVYVDPNDPSSSRVFHEGNAAFFAILVSVFAFVPFAACWVIALIKCIQCCQGRIVIYNRTGMKKGGKKVWKKIK